MFSWSGSMKIDTVQTHACNDYKRHREDDQLPSDDPDPGDIIHSGNRQTIVSYCPKNREYLRYWEKDR